MLIRCIVCGFFLLQVTLLAGCQRGPLPAESTSNAKPLANIGANGEQQFTDVTLPMPGNDGGPELEGLEAIETAAPPKLPELPQLPELPPLPEVPTIAGALENPPEPELPQPEDDLPITTESLEQPPEEAQ